MEDKSDLEEMKKQADNSFSFGALRAYINALEYRVKELEEGIRSVSEYQTPYQLEQLRKLIEEC